MDYELARAQQTMAAQESELARLRQALDQMQAICRHQTNDFPPPLPGLRKGYVHPLTCGVDARHTVLFPYWTGQRVELRCPDCDYIQTHLPGAAPPPPADDDIELDPDAGC